MCVVVFVFELYIVLAVEGNVARYVCVTFIKPLSPNIRKGEDDL